jgi:hypothetical protein
MAQAGRTPMSDDRAGASSRVLIEGLTPDEILALSDEHVATLITTGPIIFTAGSAEILARIEILADRLLMEFAQIDGGGEGVLPALWLVAERFARQRGLSSVEWIVHAVNCAQPNLKLRRVLERRGFQVKEVEGIGVAYYHRHSVRGVP